MEVRVNQRSGHWGILRSQGEIDQSLTPNKNEERTFLEWCNPKEEGKVSGDRGEEACWSQEFMGQ